VSVPAVSVVIATYNWSSVLRYSIASALRQTFDDLEVLVVGDGCTDDSEAVARSFGDRRVRWWNLEGNSGNQSRQNNFGVANARGRYVAYLGHDDLWHPSHLEELVALIERERADLAFSLAVLIDPGRRRITGLFAGPAFGEGDFVVPSSVLHHRALAREIGEWKDFRQIPIGPDADFFERAFKAGKKFVCNPRLRVCKLTSAMRPNSYVKRENVEQAEYFERILDPDFERSELLEVIRCALAGNLETMAIPASSAVLPKGWAVTVARRVRGLEPVVEVPPYDPGRDRIAVTLGGLEVPPTLSRSALWSGSVRVASQSSRDLYSGPPAPFYISYRWRDEQGGVVVADGRRSLIHPVLVPGEEVEYPVQVEAPDRTGTFTLSLSLLQEGVLWFDRPGDSVLERQVQVL
jgi:glycosyltransferase involved in cell wall biosynthesis